ncbi:MAG TPA: DEAD/DEAH box helicase [Caulobacteraceae bacterium]|nr:DEAD/DEAH box helicase [Caulobacteraceae bacterium]
MTFPAVNPALDRALADQGYVQPTPVQLAVLERGAQDKDLLVSAQTGSGKTVAYGLAMASTLLGGAERFADPGAPLALIVAPTRELAVQVHRELAWLYAHAGARLVTCVGGMDPRKEQRALAAGAHIVVGTPGRLRDHLERGHFDASALDVVVLDEADEMLDLGFREDLEFILDATPAERRTLLFSATIAREIATLAKRYQRDAVRINTAIENEPHGDIEYRAVRCAPNEVEHALVNLLRWFEARGALVFCSTREAVRRLHANLSERGFAAVALSGELTQNERTHALQSLRDGRARVCVATDVAARGLDLPDLGLVIHADLPINRAGLLHRSGRTGRAGRKGASILLVPYNRRRKAEQLLAAAGVEASWGAPPSPDEIRKRDQERLLQDPVLTEEATEEDLELARAVLAGRTAEDVATALIRMYRARLPAPEDVFDAGPPPEEKPRAFGEKRPRPERDPGERKGYGDRDPDDTGMTWFRLTIGRKNNADPKWLIPLICRLGHVTKAEIGAIRIFDRETKFEIRDEAAPKFWEAAEGASEKGVRIEPAGAPTRKGEDRPERKSYGDAPPAARKHAGFKPKGYGAGAGETSAAKKPGFKKREHAPGARAEGGPPRKFARAAETGPKKKAGPKPKR